MLALISITHSENWAKHVAVVVIVRLVRGEGWRSGKSDIIP